jgi:hypothetical protein
MTLRTTLIKEGASIYSGPLEGMDDPALHVFAGPLPSGRMYCAFWERPKPTVHVIYASGTLALDGDTWSGDIVSVRRNKVRSWRATAQRGSNVLEFVEHE